MGWVNVGASDENTNKSSTTTANQNTNYSGTNTPIIDSRFNTAFNNLSGGVNTAGLTPDQVTALQWAQNNLKNNPVNAAVTSGNGALAANSNQVGANTSQLQGNQGQYTNQQGQLQTNQGQYTNQQGALTGNTSALAGINSQWTADQSSPSWTLGSLSDKAAAGTPGYSSYAAPTDVTADKVTATQGSQYLNDYMSPYTDDVVNSTLASYDNNTNKQLNALRSGRSAASAFGDRANLSDGQFLNDSDLNRAQTESTLRNTGFNTAATLGQQDADRFLTAGTTNAANDLNASEFNNNLLNNRQQFDVNAAYEGDTMRQNALKGGESNLAQQAANVGQQTGITNSSGANIAQQTGITQSSDKNLAQQASNLQQQAGLTQQQISNVVTQNGIDTDAAQSLFAAGQISFSQLQTILQAASTYNGTSQQGTQNISGTSTTDSNSNTAKGSFGIGDN